MPNANKAGYCEIKYFPSERVRTVLLDGVPVSGGGSSTQVRILQIDESPTNQIPQPTRKTEMTEHQIHEIASKAADAAQYAVNGRSAMPATPEQAAAAVVDAYLAAQKKLTASAGSEALQPGA